MAELKRKVAVHKSDRPKTPPPLSRFILFNLVSESENLKDTYLFTSKKPALNLAKSLVRNGRGPVRVMAKLRSTGVWITLLRFVEDESNPELKKYRKYDPVRRTVK